MEQEEVQDQQQEVDNEAAFVAGFNGNNSDDHESPEKPAEKESSNSDAPEDEGGNQDEPLFAGFTESQVKGFFERSAKFDELSQQLQKAHGKIGELNRTLQEIQQRKPTHGNAPAAELEDVDLSEFESTFPEIGPVVDARARKIAQEIMAGYQPQSQSAEDIQGQIDKAVTLKVLDMTHKGWQQEVGSQDFKLWMATQPESAQQAYASTWDASEFVGFLDGFKAWKQSASSRASKSKQRLSAALVPSGSARVNHAPSDEDAFVAGFHSARPQ